MRGYSIFFFHFVSFQAFSQATAEAECGVQNRSQSRIVGGENVRGYVYPWFAQLHPPEKPHAVVCGGTLVSSHYILTAAHCYISVTENITALYSITLGLFNRCKKQSTQKTFSVNKVILHPGFSAVTNDNDIAIVKLNEPASFTPICLPAQEQWNVTNLIGEIVGYGVLKETGTTFPCILQKADVQIFSYEDCGNSRVPEKMATHFLCAGVIGGGVDSCQGDSGGALQVVDGGRFFLKGIISFGVGCALNGFPGLYSRVSYHINWIKENILK